MVDRLIFRLGDGQDFHVGWDGPWPPPPRMVVIQGRLTDGMAISDPDELSAEQQAELDAMGLTQLMFYRGDHSTMPEPWPTDAHIARAAEYTTKEKTDE